MPGDYPVSILTHELSHLILFLILLRKGTKSGWVGIWQPATATEQQSPETPNSSNKHCLLPASAKSIWDGRTEP